MSHSSIHRTTGMSVLGMLLAIPALLVILLIFSIGFYEVRKAYWDYQVREMCAKDGGIKVNETVRINPVQFRAWGGVGNLIGLPSESDNREDVPFFRRTKDQVIRPGFPQLVRLETDFVRRSDEKVLGTSVSYFRRGGDFPSWAHESSFGCPLTTAPIEQSIFVIEEKTK